MFLEIKSESGSRRGGWIEVICGSMFSGKTEELIRRLKRARISKQKVEIFKPAVDVRYDSENVVSHDLNLIASTPVEASTQILLLATDVDVVGIDEAQFFLIPNCLLYVISLPTEGCELSLQVLIWIIPENLLAQSPHC